MRHNVSSPLKKKNWRLMNKPQINSIPISKKVRLKEVNIGIFPILKEFGNG